MKTKDKLLESYYKGETSIEEEQLLKDLFRQEENVSAEKDIFGWYSQQGAVPDDLEESLFGGIKQKEQKNNIRRLFINRFTPVAASIIIVVGLFLGIRAERIRKMENNFFVMEHALYQLSQTIQPAEQEEMMVLWVDENVEIIIE
ncbi:MAG: hypothetical protein ACOC0R_01230 [Mariniphaga sp.]